MENFKASVLSFYEVEIVKLQIHMCKSENGTEEPSSSPERLFKRTSVRLNLAILLIFIGGDKE